MATKRSTPAKRKSLKQQDQPLEQLQAISGTQPADPAPSFEVSINEKIALLAYSYWEARGGQGGSPEEDWFRAEQVIRAQSRIQKV